MFVNNLGREVSGDAVSRRRMRSRGSADPDPYSLTPCVYLSKYTRNLDTEIFRKDVGDFWRCSGVPPVVAPEGGLALPRVKLSLPQCSCASEPPRVRNVPKNK